jgi:integrase
MSQYQLEVEDSYNHITFETFEKIFDTIPQLHIRKWKNVDVEYLFKLMYWSGLRPVEAIKLSKEDFHLVTRKIDLHQTKTKENDKGIIPMIFVDDLTIYLRTKKSGRLFPDLQYKTVYRWMKRLGVILDIPAWTTPRSESKEMTVGHAPRKSIGKNLIAGVHVPPDGGTYSILEVSKLLRHKKPSMTEEHYLKVSDESLKRRY